MTRARGAAIVLGTIGLLLATTPAAAVFPGSNGQIAFTRPERIFVMEADGSGLTLVRRDAGDPAWSADGSTIAFSGRRPSNKTDIFVMAADGSDVTAVTRFHPGFNLSPAWSPDGATIVFQHSSAEGNDLYVVQRDGSGLTRLTTSPRIVERAPEWSPDGSSILFSRVGPKGGYRLKNEELFVMDPDGSNLTRLTDNNVQDLQGSWSPDGERIVFARETRDLGVKAFVMAADGTGASRLTDDAMEEFWPSFSPDGTRIVMARCADFTCDLYLIAPDGTDLVQLTSGNKLESQPDWQAA
jgi:TolB protein